ncbi:hypothetical protein PhaeoP83_04245 (plasmid) [Phaeobacter inhibens]|uniref:Uncharacterized protein n=1 Tax=Phaeobacter inhibens TaxID=221822 RepID=A0ABM6RL05_9RHOB|nr:hypothetical protein PhaeoP83_04245 [Phaeobacter inhibens]AUQ97068.1 hypothetical protein PhaeoP66_04342 [Phaeobacter inhibens]AUR22268.1 hypothetical protein PhaeoP80_04245 [Phaeobacter inhibens]
MWVKELLDVLCNAKAFQEAADFNQQGFVHRPHKTGSRENAEFTTSVDISAHIKRALNVNQVNFHETRTAFCQPLVHSRWEALKR